MTRRLRLVFLLAALLALIVYVAVDVWAGRRVDAEFARLEKRYGDLDGHSIVAPSVGAEYNSARFIRAAASLTVPPAQSGTVLSSVVRLERLAGSAVTLEQARAFVDANREAIELAGKARSRHQASWDADYSGGGGVPRWLEVRALSNALYVAALLDSAGGHDDDALKRTAAGLAVSASIRHEPSLIAQLIRISVAQQQFSAVRRIVTGSEPSRAALEEVAQMLAENGESDPIGVGLRGELQLVNDALIKLERGRVTSVAEIGGTSMWAGSLNRVGRPFVRLGRRHYLLEMERLIDIERGPRPRPSSPGPQSTEHWDWRRISDTFLPGLERSIDTGDLHNSVLGVTELGVALRRYRLDRGSYPDDLSALVPAYLARLPIDPVTGKPPAYQRSGSGFTLKAEPLEIDASNNAALAWTAPK